MIIYLILLYLKLSLGLFEQCSKMLGSNIVKLLEIARNLLEIYPLLEIARIT